MSWPQPVRGDMQDLLERLYSALPAVIELVKTINGAQ
jgi:hypothetical protein